MRTLSRQDLSDILIGCSILGTGGGGELTEGYELIDEALAQGKPFRLVGIDEAPQDALVCTPYMLGAISELPEDDRQRYARLPGSDERSITLAFERLQRYLGKTFYGTISCELGGSNTAISFYVAAMSNGYIIDADPAGRAVPEITHSTYYINGLPAAPIVAANEFGECMICENIIDDQRAEDVIRSLAMISKNDIAAIDHAMTIGELRHAVIPGAISQAMELGQAHRQAQREGADIAEVIADVGKGFVAFRGNIHDSYWKTEDGFTLGGMTIKGNGEFRGDEYRIQVKNENLVAWLNDDIHTTIPDLICVIDVDTGAPVTNPNYYNGQNVAVVVLPAPKAFTTDKGLRAFGPAYLGYDFEYQPAVERFRPSGKKPSA